MVGVLQVVIFVSVVVIGYPSFADVNVRRLGGNLLQASMRIACWYTQLFSCMHFSITSFVLLATLSGY